jgi:hypothetical protein
MKPAMIAPKSGMNRPLSSTDLLSGPRLLATREKGGSAMTCHRKKKPAASRPSKKTPRKLLRAGIDLACHRTYCGLTVIVMM